MEQLTPSVCGFLAHFSPAECISKLLLGSLVIHSGLSCTPEQKYTDVPVRNTTFFSSIHAHIYGVHGNAAC
jgi:hypothetical protein